jgi:phage terminase large subunit
MSAVLQVNAEFPKKLEPLFRPARYKVLYSGRGAGKSWGVARALLILCLQRPTRVLCAREVQSSIRDSVHKLLTDQIERLGLGAHYHIEQRRIVAKNGSEFVFTGLSDQTAESIKSYHGINVCWVEEAQSVTERSWNILTKTIRPSTEGDMSEIWITFNPQLDTDPTWVQFVENRTQDTIVIPLSYRDNPWHSSVMENERLRDSLRLSPVDYRNIWEGECRPAVEGAIYADEVALMMAERRAGEFPYDAFLPVYAVWDLGWNDSMSIIIAQRHQSALRVIDYIEDDHKTLDWYSRELRQRDYTISELFLPHDGMHADYKTGQSAQRILEGLKWRVTVLPNSPIDDGIRAARMAFKSLYINKSKCERLIECLKRYRRTTPSSTGEPGAPLHDQFSHGSDCYRYLALAAPQMTGNDGQGLQLPPLKYGFEFRS